MMMAKFNQITARLSGPHTDLLRNNDLYNQVPFDLVVIDESRKCHYRNTMRDDQPVKPDRQVLSHINSNINYLLFRFQVIPIGWFFRIPYRL